MDDKRLHALNYKHVTPTGRDLRTVTFNTATGQWQVKTTRHRAYCKLRRKRNALARESRRVNRG